MRAVLKFFCLVVMVPLPGRNLRRKQVCIHVSLGTTGTTELGVTWTTASLVLVIGGSIVVLSVQFLVRCKQLKG